MFDYYLDLNTYLFEPWSKRKGRQLSKQSGYVSTPELSRVAYVAEVYLSYGHNVFLLGERGSGKTSFTKVYTCIYKNVPTHTCMHIPSIMMTCV